MSLLRYLKKGSGSVLPSPGGSLSRHMPSSSIASANKDVKSVLECWSHKPRSQTSSLLSVDRKREVSKLNVGVVLIIAIREISNHENEFDVNSRNIRPSKITRYTVPVPKQLAKCSCSVDPMTLAATRKPIGLEELALNSHRTCIYLPAFQSSAVY